MSYLRSNIDAVLAFMGANIHCLMANMVFFGCCSVEGTDFKFSSNHDDEVFPLELRHLGGEKLHYSDKKYLIVIDGVVLRVYYDLQTALAELFRHHDKGEDIFYRTVLSFEGLLVSRKSSMSRKKMRTFLRLMEKSMIVLGVSLTPRPHKHHCFWELVGLARTHFRVIERLYARLILSAKTCGIQSDNDPKVTPLEELLIFLGYNPGFKRFLCGRLIKYIKMD